MAPSQLFPFDKLTDTIKAAFSSAEDAAPPPTHAPAEAPSAREMIRKVREVLKREEFSVPVFPAIAHKVTSQIDDPRTEIADIAQMIESDPALAGQILKVANSAAFSGGTAIVTVQRAIAQLGFNRVRGLLFAVVRNNMFPRGHHRELHTTYFRQALATAAASDALGPMVRVNVEQRFLYGILHNIGRSCMLNVISEMQSRKELPREIDPATTRAIIDLTYEACGAVLAHRWKLPEDFRDVIRYHRVPERSTESEHYNAVLLTHLAISVCATWGVGYKRDPLNVIFNSPHAVRLGLNPADFDHVAKDALRRFEELTSAFGG